MSNSVNEIAVAAANSEAAREKFIHQQEALILKTASRASYRYITKSDDEWSIALSAFSDSIDAYNPSRGDFIPFAQMLVKRALIDYHRREASHLAEVSTSPFVLDGIDDAEDENDLDRSVYLAVLEQSREGTDRSLRDEIMATNELLQQFGFRFFDLTECSPQQDRSRQECAKAIRYILSRPDLMNELVKRKRLSIRTIAGGSAVSRKTLDRYRKYIIMAVLILSGDYPLLSDYLKFVWKEDDA